MPKDYKEVTRATYDSVAPSYAERDKGLVDESADVHAVLDEFSSLLPPEAAVLDIGSGAGRDSYFFAKRGFDVTGIDFAPEMVEQAKRTVPEAKFDAMDFEEIAFKDAFDGIWANASLHHVPKERLPAVLTSIHEALKPGGFFFIKVKHGESEGMRENEKFGITIQRYFAFYRNEELERLLRGAGFSIRTVRNTTKNEWVDIIAERNAES